MTEERDKCLYCRNKAVLDELMIKICDLDVSTLYLFKEQTHKGTHNDRQSIYNCS